MTEHTTDRACTATMPPGDHPVAAEHLVTTAVSRLTEALREIVDAVAVHRDVAPTSAGYVTELVSTVSGETLAWIGRWPS